MIIGPIISMIIGLDAMGMNGADFVPPYEIFLAAAIISVFAIIPIIFVIKDSSRLRESLIAKRENERTLAAETVAMSETEAVSEAEKAAE